MIDKHKFFSVTRYVTLINLLEGFLIVAIIVLALEYPWIEGLVKLFGLL